MTNNRLESPNITQYILNKVSRSDVKNVAQLIRLVQLEFSMTPEEALKYILSLQSQGKLVLKGKTTKTFSTLTEYALSANAYWYWVIITISIATVICTFNIPENAYPLVYMRYLFGVVFVLFLPGYSLTKTLFPAKELDNIERVALSIGISIVLVLITSLLLNLTHWGIRILPLTISLMVLTTTLATAAIIKEHRMLIHRR